MAGEVASASTSALRMTRERLDDQLEKLRRLWNRDKKNPRIDIPKKSHISLKSEKQDALARAFVTHLTLLEQVQGDGRAALFEGVDEAMDEDEDWHDEEDAEMSAEDE
ncbi:hypothetical protein B0H14DRAFT_3522618 [Mycena olivaceomarginata]|nr:hypothetical protein B0H14DRAFT_3522618 [Mycena olivaceomarginata]